MSEKKKRQAADPAANPEQGRERRDDTTTYPSHRNAGEFGTHGGPNKKSQKGQSGNDGTNIEGDE